MQGLFYATPILYPLSLVPLVAAKLLLLTPIAQIIQDIRYILVTDKTTTIHTLYGDWEMWLIPVGTTIVLAITAAFYFKKRSKYFAEEV